MLTLEELKKKIQNEPENVMQQVSDNQSDKEIDIEDVYRLIASYAIQIRLNTLTCEDFGRDFVLSDHLGEVFTEAAHQGKDYVMLVQPGDSAYEQAEGDSITWTSMPKDEIYRLTPKMIVSWLAEYHNFICEQVAKQYPVLDDTTTLYDMVTAAIYNQVRTIILSRVPHFGYKIYSNLFTDDYYIDINHPMAALETDDEDDCDCDDDDDYPWDNED